MTVELRRATHDDWKVYRDIRLRALAGAPGAYGSTLQRESEFDESVWRSRSGDSHLLFGLLDGDVVAIAAGIPDSHETDSKEIVGMWVDPDARRHGLAQALVTALAEWATEIGAPAIALWVVEGNDAARRVYERCGFVTTGERELLRDEVYEVRMRRSLR